MPNLPESYVFLLYLHLVNHVQGIGQDSKYDIQEEERADQHKRDTKDDCHPPDVAVHKQIHYCGPLLESDHLEDC